MNGLAGKRVVVTRPLPEGAELARRLTEVGAIPLLFPTIVRHLVREGEALNAALASLGALDWVAVTSPASAEVLAPALVATPVAPRVAAVGRATAGALQRYGVPVAHVGPGPGGETLAGSIPDLRGRTVLLPRSSRGRSETEVALRRAGAEVWSLAIYRTETPALGPDGLAPLRAGVDALLFTSPTTITGFLALTGAEGPQWLAQAHVVCLGPTTAAAAREAGVAHPAVAASPDVDGLLTGLESCFTPPLPGP